MPTITALLHTENDALRLGRCLETLYPCDYIVVIDHGSRDSTARVARQYGAKVVAGSSAITPTEYIRSLSPGWILTLDPRESLTESLAASLFEWKAETEEQFAPPAFSVFLREETASGWMDLAAAQTRLVPSTWVRWNGMFPMQSPGAKALEGELLRFAFP